MTWKNDTGKKIFVDANGNLVEDGSPYAATLLVDVDGTLKKAEAEKYGLLVEEDAVAPTEQPAHASTAPKSAPAEAATIKPRTLAPGEKLQEGKAG